MGNTWTTRPFRPTTLTCSTQMKWDGNMICCTRHGIWSKIVWQGKFGVYSSCWTDRGRTRSLGVPLTKYERRNAHIHEWCVSFRKINTKENQHSLFFLAAGTRAGNTTVKHTTWQMFAPKGWKGFCRPTRKIDDKRSNLWWTKVSLDEWTPLFWVLKSYYNCQK